MQANESNVKIYDDALANWHTTNERMEKSGPGTAVILCGSVV